MLLWPAVKKKHLGRPHYVTITPYTWSNRSRGKTRRRGGTYLRLQSQIIHLRLQRLKYSCAHNSFSFFPTISFILFVFVLCSRSFHCLLSALRGTGGCAVLSALSSIFPVWTRSDGPSARSQDRITDSLCVSARPELNVQIAFNQIKSKLSHYGQWKS